MHARRKILLGVLAALVATTTVYLGIAYAQVGDTRTDAHVLARRSAQGLQAMIDPGIGSFHLAEGASGLLDARFAYNISIWKPSVGYAVQGTHEQIHIHQPSARFLWFLPFRTTHNDWKVRLNNDVPTDLCLSLGVGTSDLALGGMNLRALRVHAAIGETMVDLTGNWKHDFDAGINGGGGGLALRLPSTVGVHVDVKPSVGGITGSGLYRDGDTYTNAANGVAPITLHIHMYGGIGSVIMTAKR